MQLDIMAATKAIRDRLALSIQEVPIQGFPSNPQKTFETLVHAKGEINVRFFGSKYLPPVPNPQGVVMQRRDVTFEAFIRCRDWSGMDPQGSTYLLMQMVSQALVGWTLPDVADAAKFQMTSDGIVDFDEGIWRSQVLVTCQVPHEEAA